MEPCYTRLRPFEPTKPIDGAYYCKQCGARLSGRRTAYCSEGCETAYLIPRDWNVAKWHVECRDGGVCALCGRDTTLINVKLRQFGMRFDADRRGVWDEWSAYKLQLMREGFNTTSLHSPYYSHTTFFDVDHIVPVCEGGGGCGLEGLRTLCHPCHKAETKALAQRRKEAKRGLEGRLSE